MGLGLCSILFSFINKMRSCRIKVNTCTLYYHVYILQESLCYFVLKVSGSFSFNKPTIFEFKPYQLPTSKKCQTCKFYVFILSLAIDLCNFSRHCYQLFYVLCSAYLLFHNSIISLDKPGKKSPRTIQSTAWTG